MVEGDGRRMLELTSQMADATSHLMEITGGLLGVRVGEATQPGLPRSKPLPWAALLVDCDRDPDHVFGHKS